MGTVTELGSKVPKSYLHSRRGFFTKGSVSSTHGAFAEYVAVAYDLTFEIPSSVTDAEAATLPIPFFTAVLALFHPKKLGLIEPPGPPKEKDEWILIWSGSTAVGMYAIQLAKLAGYKVVVTASESGWKLLKEFGADELFDYKDDEVLEKIRELTKTSPIQVALDWQVLFFLHLQSDI